MPLSEKQGVGSSILPLATRFLPLLLKTVTKVINLKNCRIVFIEIMRENKTEVYDLLKDFNLLPIIESKEDIGNYVFKKTNL